MKIKIDNDANNKLIWVTVDCSSFEEIKLKEQAYKTILLQLLNGSSISLITIEPQSYSLAYDIIPYQSRTIGDHHFLVNDIAKCDFELIEKIVLSEEFRRTLLFIIKRQLPLLDENLMNVSNWIKGKSAILMEEVFFCEDDGSSLCLLNTAIDFDELISISKALTDDVEIETIVRSS